MTTFWIFIAIVVLVSLGLIWLPHFRQQKLLKAEESGVRKQTNLELFNERLAILEKERQEELLDQDEFESLKKNWKSAYCRTSNKEPTNHSTLRPSLKGYSGQV